MLRSVLLASAAFAAASLGACVSDEPMTSAAAAPGASATVPAETAPTGTFTDAQVNAYVATSREVARINSALSANATAAQREQAGVEVGQVLQRHNLDYATYNAINERITTDQQLANRVAVQRVGSVTNAELVNFIGASEEIDPINRGLVNATAEQRAQAAQQIRAILVRYNLDTTTYNGIAVRAQNDQTFAERLANLREETESNG